MQMKTLKIKRTIASGFQGLTDNIAPNYITPLEVTMEKAVSAKAQSLRRSPERAMVSGVDLEEDPMRKAP